MNETDNKRLSKETARLIFAAFDEKKAEDIAVLEIAGLSPLADYFVIATSKNKAQTDALVYACAAGAEKNGAKIIYAEGQDAHGWTLLDFGDVLAHIFAPKERAFYDLERLWADAKRIEGEFAV